MFNLIVWGLIGIITIIGESKTKAKHLYKMYVLMYIALMLSLAKGLF